MNPEARRYVRCVSFRVVREPAPATRERCDSPEAVAALAGQLIPDDAREHFYVLMLDSQNRLLDVHHISTGSLSASIVHPRDVLGPALRSMGVAHLILLHNHPSGDPTPSKEDLQLTRQLVEGARLLGLRIHDHLILGSGSGQWVSLAQRGAL